MGSLRCGLRFGFSSRILRAAWASLALIAAARDSMAFVPVLIRLVQRSNKGLSIRGVTSLLRFLFCVMLAQMVALPPELRDAPELPLIIQEGVSWMQNERLLRNEFRNWLTPEIKAEFINGEKIVHSPSRYAHCDAQVNLVAILSTFAQIHSLGIVLGEKALVELSRNDYEPDVVFFGNAKASKFYRNQMVFPVPDLTIEILSESTEDRDRGVKFRDYAAHEIPEYWIVDADAKQVERYVNLSGKYILQPAAEVIVTPLFPGLQLPVAAIFDSAARLDVIRLIVKG